MHSTATGSDKCTAGAHLKQQCPRFIDLSQNRAKSQTNDVVRIRDEAVIRRILSTMTLLLSKNSDYFPYTKQRILRT